MALGVRDGHGGGGGCGGDGGDWRRVSASPTTVATGLASISKLVLFQALLPNRLSSNLVGGIPIPVLTAGGAVSLRTSIGSSSVAKLCSRGVTQARRSSMSPLHR